MRDLTHHILADQAKESVANTGKFDHHEVIHDAGLGKFEDRIEAGVKWPWIHDEVAAEAGELVPTATPQSARYQPDIHPEQFLSGRGRPISGAALPTVYPEVSKVYIMREYKTAMTRMANMERRALSFQKQGLGITYRPAGKPLLELPAAAAE